MHDAGRRGLRLGRAGRQHSVALVAMSLVAIGLWSTMGPFWALTTRMVGWRGRSRRGRHHHHHRRLRRLPRPLLHRPQRDATHSFAGGLYAIGALALCAALLTLAAPSKPQADRS